MFLGVSKYIFHRRNLYIYKYIILDMSKKTIKKYKTREGKIRVER